MGIVIAQENEFSDVQIGYSTFYKIRVWCARTKSLRFGALYEKLCSFKNINLPIEDKKAFSIEFNNKVDKLISDDVITKGFLSFCMQSDCGGNIDAEVCKELLELFNNNQDDANRYFADYLDEIEEFKEVLRECIDENANFNGDNIDIFKTLKEGDDYECFLLSYRRFKEFY